MEPTDVVYDLCRHFIADYSPTVDQGLIAKVSGWHRARLLDKLADATSLFHSATHNGLDLKFLLQIEALFKKCAHFSSEKCDEVAMLSFRESEEICKETNRRLDVHYHSCPERLAKVVERMRHIIADTLGPSRPFLEALPSLVRATSGATATHPRSRSGGVERLKRTTYATLGSHPYLESLATFWGYKCRLRKIHHNRVELVPKNWKTSRTIACEPEGNVFLQLAFDSFCKRRLRSRLNIDLSDQSRNQRLALESSISGTLCTVDLKAASDRLALNVVHLLFDREWVDFFLATRSPCWKERDGTLVPYHKLSSMGNGYTFTIETLVFAAACKAVGSKEFSVYGDDIIIETRLFQELSDLLAYLGFEVNNRKSHVDTRSISYELDRASRGNLERGCHERGESPCGDHTLRHDRFRDANLSGHDHGENLLAWLDRSVGTRPLSESPGVYRESCGIHAYGGHVITPFYVRSLRTKRDWVLLANNIAAFAPLGGKVWEYGRRIVSTLNLPLGPLNLDPCSCVFIDTYTCYRLGLIRTDRKAGPYAWQPRFRALIPRSKEVRCYDSRALFLWHLGRKESPFESSRYSLGTSKYRSKWVRFRPQGLERMGGSVRLHWWTELLTAGDGR